MERWSTYEPFHVLLGDRKISDIVITNHARSRWNDRISDTMDDAETIGAWMWECLKKQRITPYYRNEQDVYLIDEDIVVVVEFTDSNQDLDLTGTPLTKLIVVTFLGRMSEMIELRDLRSYYSWLRHGRRTTLMKNSRKKK